MATPAGPPITGSARLDAPTRQTGSELVVLTTSRVVTPTILRCAHILQETQFYRVYNYSHHCLGTGDTSIDSKRSSKVIPGLSWHTSGNKHKVAHREALL